MRRDGIAVALGLLLGAMLGPVYAAAAFAGLVLAVAIERVACGPEID